MINDYEMIEVTLPSMTWKAGQKVRVISILEGSDPDMKKYLGKEGVLTGFWNNNFVVNFDNDYYKLIYFERAELQRL